MCYSTYRALLSSFTSFVGTCRRTSDDEPYLLNQTETREIDPSALVTFSGDGAGGGEVALVTLSNQIGPFGNRDLIQMVAEDQRIIVSGGNLVTVGGKAASRGLRPPGSGPIGGVMKTVPFTPYTGTQCSVFLRGKHGVYSGVFTVIVDAYFALGKHTNSSSISHPGACHTPGGGFNITWTGYSTADFVSDYLLSFIWNGSSLTIRDGVSTWTFAASPTFDFNKFIIGAFDDTSNEYASDANNIQEVAVWYSDQTANEAAIRSAMLA